MNKNLEEYLPDGNKAQYRFMKYRIHKILLVCCSYDGFIRFGHLLCWLLQRHHLCTNRRNIRFWQGEEFAIPLIEPLCNVSGQFQMLLLVNTNRH